MLPGKLYKPEDFLEIAWRRKWMLVVPLVIAGVGTFVWTQQLPNRYRSEATVLVIPPQVPVSFVKPTTTESLQDRLNLMRQQILSRTRLERLVEEFNLYPRERRTQLMDDVVEQMVRDIGINVPKVGRKRQPDHFVVSFDSESPQTAMVVTERLASLFVRENLEGRGNQADATTQFLQSQVDEALRKLQEHESRLSLFRRQHAGRLPEEVESNLQIMQSSRQESQVLTDSINRDRDRQITIERMIADEIALGPVAAKVSKGGAAVAQSAAQELAAAQAALTTLQMRLKDDHPDVRIAKNRITELEKKAEAEALQQPLSDDTRSGPLTAADVDKARRLATLRNEFDGLERGLAVKRAKLQKSQAMVTDYQQRVQAAPLLDSQLAGLMRDQGILKTTYENLLRKAQDARLSANLEQRQVGEQFRVINSARLPERPHSPKRVRMNLTGALLGLAFGLAIAGLSAYRDTSVRTEEDVLVTLSLPVVALVPTIHTEIELTKVRWRRRLMLGSSAVLTLVVAVAAVVWKLRLFESWGR